MRSSRGRASGWRGAIAEPGAGGALLMSAPFKRRCASARTRWRGAARLCQSRSGSPGTRSVSSVEAWKTVRGCARPCGEGLVAARSAATLVASARQAWLPWERSRSQPNHPNSPFYAGCSSSEAEQDGVRLEAAYHRKRLVAARSAPTRAALHFTDDARVPGQDEPMFRPQVCHRAWPHPAAATR